MKVLIKDKKLGRNQNTGRAELQSEGLPLHKALAGEEDVVLFDQSNIIMILEGEIPAEFSEEALKDDRLETKAKTGPIGLITRG